MSDSVLTHRTRSQPVTVATAAAASATVDIRDVAGGIVHVSGTTATHTFTVYGSSDGTSFVTVYGTDGQAASVTVPAGESAYCLPDAVYPLRFVRLVSGTDIGTAASVVVSVKS